MNRPKNKYDDEMCMTEMCMELHQGQPDTERRGELIDFLEQKICDWKYENESGFDEALRHLILAAITETGR